MRILIILSAALLLLIIAFLLVLFLVLTPSDRRLLFSGSESINIEGKTRQYRLVNASQDDSQSKPLIIGLHGFRDRPEWLAAYSGLHLLAEQEGAILALPSGLRNSWNGSFCCGWAWQNNATDTEFILEMIESIKQDHQIDATRIYVVGFSNGGILAQKLLQEAPGTFAAGAAVMSGVGDSNNTLDISEAVAPILLVNGTADNYVPLEQMQPGVTGFNFLPAFDSANIWAEHYGLSDREATTVNGFDRYTWQNGPDRQLEQHIYETSHRWPNWRLYSLPTEVPSSTQAIWDFLSTHQG